MLSRVSSPKDFWTGLIYVALGLAALWLGRDYRFGAAGRMGPGYFPLVLAGILVVLGLISLTRSLVAKGEGIGTIAWKPLALVLAGCALFGLLLHSLGLPVALLVLCLVSAAASREFAFDWKATAGLLALIVFCAAVFIKGLRLPMPLVGSWLEPLASSLAAWLG